MNMQIPENRKISPFFAFILIYANQIGIGILTFQRLISKEAGYDAWISVLMTGVCAHFIVWMIVKMLGTVEGDILSVHEFVFGKWAAKIAGIVFIIYLGLGMITVLRSYIEIVQVWMFPRLQTFWFALVFLFLVLYVVTGGFRVLTGMAFISSVLSVYVFFIFLFALPYANFANLLPILDHSFTDLLKGSRTMAFSFTGFELILFYYPFLKKPEKVQKWAQLAIAVCTVLYLYLTVITFAYFPEAQIQKNIWPSLTIWKIIEMPFLERFEYIGVATWCLVILPNVCIPLWAASRLAKHVFSIRQRTAVPVFALLCLIAVSMISTRKQINFLASITGTMGFYIDFVYLPLIFLATLLAKKVKKSGPSS